MLDGWYCPSTMANNKQAVEQQPLTVTGTSQSSSGTAPPNPHQPIVGSEASTSRKSRQRIRDASACPSAMLLNNAGAVLADLKVEPADADMDTSDAAQDRLLAAPVEPVVARSASGRSRSAQRTKTATVAPQNGHGSASLAAKCEAGVQPNGHGEHSVHPKCEGDEQIDAGENVCANGAASDAVDYRAQYMALKKKLKFLLYENEFFQDAMRSSQRRLLKVTRDRSFLLDRLLKYEQPDETTSESDPDTDSSDDGTEASLRRKVARRPANATGANVANGVTVANGAYGPNATNRANGTNGPSMANGPVVSQTLPVAQPAQFKLHPLLTHPMHSSRFQNPYHKEYYERQKLLQQQEELLRQQEQQLAQRQQQLQTQLMPPPPAAVLRKKPASASQPAVQPAPSAPRLQPAKPAAAFRPAQAPMVPAHAQAQAQRKKLKLRKRKQKIAAGIRKQLEAQLLDVAGSAQRTQAGQPDAQAQKPGSAPGAVLRQTPAVPIAGQAVQQPQPRQPLPAVQQLDVQQPKQEPKQPQQPSYTDGHMTAEEVERHLQSRHKLMELVPERAPTTVPNEMFSDEPPGVLMSGDGPDDGPDAPNAPRDNVGPSAGNYQ